MSKEKLQEKIINDYIKEEGHDNFMLFEDDLRELMKRSYNQAIDDADENVVYNKEGHLEYKYPINKLKIK